MKSTDDSANGAPCETLFAVKLLWFFFFVVVVIILLTNNATICLHFICWSVFILFHVKTHWYHQNAPYNDNNINMVTNDNNRVQRLLSVAHVYWKTIYISHKATIRVNKLKNSHGTHRAGAVFFASQLPVFFFNCSGVFQLNVDFIIMRLIVAFIPVV